METNERYAITLGKVSGKLADQLQGVLGMAALIDVVRLALATLRLLIVVERAGWRIAVFAANGQEFTFSPEKPNKLVAVKSSAVGRKGRQGGSDGGLFAVRETIDVGEIEAAVASANGKRAKLSLVSA